MTDFVVIKSRKLSKHGDKRYVVASKGKVVDDANGMGYKNKQNAYASFVHKRKAKVV